MTYQEFKNKYNGKYTDYDGYYGCQCWDLAQRYFTECLGLPEGILSGCGLVSNMLYPPKREVLNKYFDEIDVHCMIPGDVCIWERGHIAMFDNWDGSNCWYFSQNPNPSQVMTINMGKMYAFRKKEEKKKEKVDQWLNPGSHVQIPGTFEVIDINVKDNTALVRIDGKDYWLSSTPLLEVE